MEEACWIEYAFTPNVTFTITSVATGMHSGKPPNTQRQNLTVALVSKYTQIPKLVVSNSEHCRFHHRLPLTRYALMRLRAG